MAHEPLPRDDLFRALPAGIDVVRSETNPDEMPTLAGHFAVFDQYTEIDSMWEGNFLERIAPGAFRKTMRENRDSMRVLFQHGQDPQIGDKVLGKISQLREDDLGAAYEVPMLDTSYNRDLIPGLEAGLYGASFRFRVMREEIVDEPSASDYNPRGLPERTIKEAQVKEFGPVTFPAYAGATAGLRSLTDEFMFGKFLDDPEKLAFLIQERKNAARIFVPATANTTTTQAVVLERSTTEDEPPEPDPQPDPAPDDDSAEEATHPVVSRREPETTPTRNKETTMAETADELRARIEEIGERLRAILSEAGTLRLNEEQTTERDDLVAERNDLMERIKEYDANCALLREISGDPRHVERTEEKPKPQTGYDRTRHGDVHVPGNPWDESAYVDVNSPRNIPRALQDGARRVIDQMTFSHPDANREDNQEHMERLLEKLDSTEAKMSRYVLATSGPVYQRAFGKWMGRLPLTTEEDNALKRAASLTTTAGGFAVPVALDPTVILTNNGAINPVRLVSRVDQIMGNTWDGVTSAGVTAVFAGEAVEAADGAPVLAQPVLNVEKAHVAVPYSFEIGADWQNFEGEMTRMISDAKDILECDKYTNGFGHVTNTPEGYLKGATSVVTTAATATLAVADLYSVKNALPPRFRPNATWLAEGTQFDRIRQFDTAGGSSLWAQLGEDRPAVLLGKNTYENSAAPSTITSNSSAVTYGDFSNFLIADRVGLSVSHIPLLATANNLPNGQAAIYAYWRTSSKVLAWQAFRTIKAL